VFAKRRANTVAHPGGATFPTSAPVHRRGFLAATASALLAPRGGAAAPQRPVVDTHVHVWSDGKGRFPYAHPYKPGDVPKAAGTVEMLLADMDRHGVSHAVLVQMIHHGWDNRYLAQCVKDHPRRLKAHGLIDPTDPKVADRLAYWVNEHGLAGMRFSPIYYQGRDDWMTSAAHRAAWKRAAELGAVFNFYISTKQLPKLGAMIRAFPDVPVIIDHLGQLDLKGGDPVPELVKLLALSRYPRVWVKVSELTSVSKSGKYPFADAFPWVKRVYEAFGPDRLLWGTGYPGAARAAYGRPTLQQELALVRKEIPFVSAADREKVLGQNAARLWKFGA
jgi:predicted TIM-barrel fold metal-dependent hydrolase